MSATAAPTLQLDGIETYYGTIQAGTVSLSGTAQALREDESVRKTYLGEE